MVWKIECIEFIEYMRYKIQVYKDTAKAVKLIIRKNLNWKPWLNLMKPVLTMIPHRRQIPRPQYVLGTTSP